MQQIQEKKIGHINGFIMVFIDLLLIASAVLTICYSITNYKNSTYLWLIIFFIVFFIFILNKSGYFLIHPNEAKTFVFLGKYIGSAKDPGFYWTNPFAIRKTVTLRVCNFNSATIKVNEALGNPIEIAAVIVYKVTDSAKAIFDVENYENFVSIQSETAIRILANHFPYDSHDNYKESLRGNQENISLILKKELQERLNVAGVSIIEARISHLAYAPEIAQVMLRRQQAEAIISARKLIVEGAVGMVELALNKLEKQGVVKLDEEKKASMVNNLLVSLVSESETQPVINTGTLYS